MSRNSRSRAHVRLAARYAGLVAAAMLLAAAEPAPLGTRLALLVPTPLVPTSLVPGGVLTQHRPSRFVPAEAEPSPAPDPLDAPPAHLERIAFAVEGIESRHGRDPGMWRPDPSGPQGPMQVSLAAALDVGGGNRFDPMENRALGRAYLARMYQRYGNWRDSLLAYNWGPGNLDQWIRAGRPSEALSPTVQSYVTRVMRDSFALGDPPLSFAMVGAPPPKPASLNTPRQDRIALKPATSAEALVDPKLRGKVRDNNRLIERLRLFLDATETAELRSRAPLRDPTAAWLREVGIMPELLASGDALALRQLQDVGSKLLFATARAVAGRPGFENFNAAKGAGPRAVADLTVARLMVSVLLAKLEEENNTFRLVDAHRRDDPGRVRPATASGSEAARRG